MAWWLARTSTSDVRMAAAYSNGGSRPTQHDLGIECVVGHTRDQRGEEADDDEDQRRAKTQPLRRAGDDGDRHHQRQDLHCFAHASIMPVTGLTARGWQGDVRNAGSLDHVLAVCRHHLLWVFWPTWSPVRFLFTSRPRCFLANSDGVRHPHASVPPQSPHALTPSAPTVRRSPERQPQPQRPAVRQPVAQPVAVRACPPAGVRPGRRAGPSARCCFRRPGACRADVRRARPARADSSPRSPARGIESPVRRSRPARCPTRSPAATCSAARRPARARPWPSACRCSPGSPRASTHRRAGTPRGLVLVPTRELAQQVTDALAPLGAGARRQGHRRLRRCADGPPDRRPRARRRHRRRHARAGCST